MNEWVDGCGDVGGGGVRVCVCVSVYMCVRERVCCDMRGGGVPTCNTRHHQHGENNTFTHDGAFPSCYTHTLQIFS